MIALGPARPVDTPAAVPPGPWSAALAIACSGAPYLARLAERWPESAAALAAQGPGPQVAAAIAAADRLAADADPDAVRDGLRAAKAEAHLAVAVADLAGAWSQAQATAALSAFADAAVRAALAGAVTLLQRSGEWRAGAGPEGVVLLAMGKLGARELNYSSDIDVSVFFDPDRLPVAAGREARVVAVRLARHLVALLEDRTALGYVFRTDLRLRPDPASTPVAVALPAAEAYYQSVGQNWERAAFIKARAIAGDAAAGAAFLDGLTPFIWRRSLDYAAIADVQSIKRQILSVHKTADLAEPVFDLKLGRGGIRDIELFAQTQQLILGGRDPSLRAPGTLDALAALCAAGHVAAGDRDALAAAYGFYRGVEHRVQMIADEQTHKVPADEAGRSRLAALCGLADRAALEAALVAARAKVARIDAGLFPEAASLADPLGSLSFTGVEDNAETLATLRAMGFAHPAAVSGGIRGWHHGRIRCMRSARARELLTALTPALLRALAESGEPDAAFARFAQFFAGLPSAVSVLSLLRARPALLVALAEALGVSAKLAALLASRPNLLDAATEPQFDAPLADDRPGARAARFAALPIAPFETALSAARRLHREEAFRIHMAVLRGRCAPAEAGAAHADLADACVAFIAAAAAAETTRRHGPAPGRWVIVALGKFGGRELAAGSDLDLMVVYEPEDGAPGAGPAEYFSRFTQRLIAGLSSPTEEGSLYEVDMQLRPSGTKGPVAVRLSSFARYYLEEAWTWELLALTRLRIAAGDADLGARVEAAAAAALACPRDRAAVLADVTAMRARMARERPAKGPWDLKLAPGGFVDLEFIVQTRTLLAGPETGGAAWANTGAALAAQGGPEALVGAFELYCSLQQLLRLIDDGRRGPEALSRRAQALLASAAGAGEVSAVGERLAQAQAAVRREFSRFFGDAGDGSSGQSR